MMSLPLQCPRCGRTFRSGWSTTCWNCGSEAKNPLLEGFKWLIGLTIAGIVIWYVLYLTFHVFALFVSVVPVAFGIVAMYAVAAVSAEGGPAIPSAAHPALAFIFGWTAVRMLAFLCGRGRKGLLFISLYLLLAIVVGLVLTYTEVRPFGIDPASRAATAPAMVAERTEIIAYVLQGIWPEIVSASEALTDFTASFDTDLLSIALVVYCFILPMELALFIRALARLIGRRGRQTAEPRPAQASSEIVEQ